MTGPAVVVGVSPNSGSPGALRWGADEARLRGVPLRAVMAWHSPRPPAGPTALASVHTASGAATGAEAAAVETLRGFVAGALGSADGVECRVVEGTAVNALISAAGEAELLVVGESRAGAAGTVRTGWLAPQLISKAHCPVVVMPNSHVT
ncbi:MAG TPA: universal stress protein [Amycolatopsis sp.]|nr:universal stress protein [Amycolatopsis sp.]